MVKFHSILIFVALFAVACTTAPNPMTPTATHGSLIVSVVDAVTNQPIIGADVSHAQLFDGHTDANGQVTIDVPYGVPTEIIVYTFDHGMYRHTETFTAAMKIYRVPMTSER